MDLQARMQLHVLVYKIVSQRILCGNYLDSEGVRNKLEVETQKRIRRLAELENRTELESALSLHDLYSGTLASRKAPKRAADVMHTVNS
jgi:uncharacterized membrane protein YqiK